MRNYYSLRYEFIILRIFWKSLFDTADTARRVPTSKNKRYLYINLKFGQPFYPNKPTFPLDLLVEALDSVEIIRIVRCFLCDKHIVRVAFFQARAGDADKFRFGLQFHNVVATAIAHTGF